jgi:hypothetical protein
LSRAPANPAGSEKDHEQPPTNTSTSTASLHHHVGQTQNHSAPGTETSQPPSRRQRDTRGFGPELREHRRNQGIQLLHQGRSSTSAASSRVSRVAFVSGQFPSLHFSMELNCLLRGSPTAGQAALCPSGALPVWASLGQLPRALGPAPPGTPVTELPDLSCRQPHSRHTASRHSIPAYVWCLAPLLH